MVYLDEILRKYIN
jgi:hypothetical protein